MADDLRIRGVDMCMSDAMPFQQHWEARTTWPLEDVLNDKYFLNVRDQLRAGDEVVICRYDGTDTNHTKVKLLETVTVRILECGRDKAAVPLGLVGEVLRFGEPVPGQGGLSVRRGQAGKFKLMDGETVIAEYGSKGEAEAAMNQKRAA